MPTENTPSFEYDVGVTLYCIEGSSPNVSKRRKNFTKLLLEYEFRLDVESISNAKRPWDLKEKIGNQHHIIP